MKIQYLGGASEVGRSCIAIHIKNDTTLLDCGIKVKGTTIDEKYPYIENIINKNNIRRRIITHAHMDHCGALPYFLNHYPKTKVYMTEPTKNIMNVMLEDNMRLTNDRESEIPTYTEEDIIRISRNTTITPSSFISDIHFLYRRNATIMRVGHIIGAIAVLYKTNEGNVLYTGDYTAQQSRLIDSEKFSNYLKYKKIPIDIMISEGTYGKSEQKNKETEIIRLIEDITKTLEQKGKVLIPAFAVGRSQEIIMLLKETITTKIPIYVDGLIRTINCLYGYNYRYLKRKYQKEARYSQNIFIADNVIDINSDKERQELITNNESCIIVSSSGMLSGGPSVYYAKQLLVDKNSLIAIVGYQDEDSPGNALLEATTNSDSITFDNEKYKINCKVEKYSFSGHADKNDIINTIKKVNPKQIHLVHGDHQALKNIKNLLAKENITNVIIPEINKTYEL